MKFVPIFSLLLFLNLHSQTIDTLSSDTTKTVSNTVKIINDTTATDTSALFNADTTYAKADTTYPLYQEPFYSSSFFINRETINKLDYRYTGDMFTPFNLSFLRDQGFAGQPNELLLYGTGFNGISYFEDGVFINNRFNNSLDLNLVQSEHLDSIEIIPSPRGFLYGTYNNPVSVNFLTRDFISLSPYTRIKYYEGPFGDAMADGIFNSLLFGKFNLSFDITNKKFDSSYTNTEFSIWQAKVKLKYLLSNSVNIIGSYYLVDSDVGLNGGVDVDSISRSTSDINSVLYNETFAPVVFNDQKLEIKQHNFGLKLLGNFRENFKTDINLYYRFNQDLLSRGVDFTKDKQNVFGVSLKQKYETDILKFELNGNYDYTDFEYVSKNNNIFNETSAKIKFLSISPLASFNLLNGIIKPSLFYKYTSRKDEEQVNISRSFNGYGFDVDVKLNEMLKLYFGYSTYESITEDKIKTLELSLKYSQPKLFISLTLFNRNGTLPLPNYFVNDIFRTYRDPEMWGIGASINLQIWHILIESNSTLYLPQNSEVAVTQPNQLSFAGLNFVSGFPGFIFKGGIYYKDILFNDNLDLKTGFSVQYVGEQKRFVDPLENTTYIAGIIESSYKIDFTLAGEIQKTAIVYFVWENLLDENYYIVPYYPMRERGIRFGIAWELFN